MVGDLGAVVAPDDVQSEIERGGAAGRGQHVAVVDEEHVGFQVDRGKAQPELLGQIPVDRRPAPVEQAGLGERERARAEAHQAGAALVGAAQGGEQGRAGRGLDVRAVGHDHRMGVLDLVEAPHRADAEQGVAHGGRPARSGHPQVVKGEADVGPERAAEDLAGAPHLEGIGLLVDDEDDPV